jgi:hypothetical protein
MVASSSLPSWIVDMWLFVGVTLLPGFVSAGAAASDGDCAQSGGLEIHDRQQLHGMWQFVGLAWVTSSCPL